MGQTMRDMKVGRAHTSRWRRRLARGGILALPVFVGVAMAAGVAVRDPIDRPSGLSTKATTLLLTAVARDGDRLVAVGERGTVLTSEDGKQWTQQATPVSVMLTGVRFGRGGVGWAVGHGGVVLRTTDGGRHWTRVLEGVRLAQLVAKAAESRLAASQPGTVEAEAAQRAQQSAQLLIDDGPDKPLLDVLVDDDGTVLVVGAFGLAMATRDGGASWEDWQARIPNPGGSHLYGASKIGDALYLVGEQGLVLRSTDRGISFSAVPPPYKGSLFGITEAGDRGVMVFGLRGHAFLSKDGGGQWQAVKLPTSATINAGTRLKTGATVLATQAGDVLLSVDGGESFHAVPIKTPVPFVGVSQATDGALVLAGVRGITSLPLAPFTASANKP